MYVRAVRASRLIILIIYTVVPPPQYRPSVDRLRTCPPTRPPIPPLIFKSRIFFFLVTITYKTPFTAVFQYRRFFASPESGSIYCGRGSTVCVFYPNKQQLYIFIYLVLIT